MPESVDYSYRHTFTGYNPKQIKTQSNHEKISDKPQRRDILQNTSCTPKKCQGHERQGKTEGLSQIGGDQGGMTARCKVGSWI